MQDELFKTRYSKYGYGIDVRRTYKDLPCQPFWTWVTGKSLNDRPPRRPKDTLLKPWQLYLHISWGYAVFFLAVIYGQQLLASQQPLWLKCLLGALIMCLVVNRQRGFLHTFHYTTHGASLENKALARFTCKWILSIPILHTPRDEYVKLHVNEHHSVRTFNTEHDVDLVFMKQHGFYKGMSESAFWTRLVLAPFHPARILEHLKFRFDVSFVSAPRHGASAGRSTGPRCSAWCTPAATWRRSRCSTCSRSSSSPSTRRGSSTSPSTSGSPATSTACRASCTTAR